MSIILMGNFIIADTFSVNGTKRLLHQNSISIKKVKIKI